MTTEDVGELEVAWDGRTVWVNDVEGMVARFGPAGFEVKANRRDWIRRILRPAFAAEDWGDFVKLVGPRFDVHLTEKHRPTWVRMPLAEEVDRG